MNKITIVITRYNETDDLVNPCLIAVSKQRDIQAIVYFLDQKQDKKIKSLCKKLSNKNIQLIYKNIPVKSLSYARNIGIKLSKTDIVLFTDADAIPNTNWATSLAQIFNSKKRIAIVGGKSIAKWLIKPKWYHKSNILMDAYSILDKGNKTKETDTIVGVNFGLNKNLLKKEAFFDEDLGRRPGSLLGGEESDLCKRTIKKGFKVFYNGESIVQHQVQKDRMNLSWVLKRAYYWGYGRAMLGGAPRIYATQRNFYDKLVLLIIFPAYVVGFFIGKIKRIKQK